MKNSKVPAAAALTHTPRAPRLLPQAMVALACLLLCAPPADAAWRQILSSGDMKVLVSEPGPWCRETAEVHVQAPSEEAFKGDRLALQRLTGQIRLVLEDECPAAVRMVVVGSVRDQRVFIGTAAKDQGWTLAAISAEQAATFLQSRPPAAKDRDQTSASAAAPPAPAAPAAEGTAHQTTSAAAQDNYFRFFDMFSGRFHCGGQWTDFQFKANPVPGLLGMDDPDAGVNASIRFFDRRGLSTGVAYALTGPYDRKTGRFHLEPKQWYGPHPDAFEMVGIEGTFDAATRQISAEMLSPKCDAVMMVARGVTLPPLPPEAAPPRARALDPKRPEMSLAPVNVTGYLDVAAYNPDFEYLVSAWFDTLGTVREGEPIDESVAGMKKGKFACADSQQVAWDPAGVKGTAPGRVTITERFVVECVGDCKGVFYRPYVGAQVAHFGLSEPLPTMQIKSVWFGGTSFRWNFSRTSKSQPPPRVYVHHWTPLAGFGPLDAGPAEVARRQAAAPPCKAETVKP